MECNHQVVRLRFSINHRYTWSVPSSLPQEHKRPLRPTDQIAVIRGQRLMKKVGWGSGDCCCSPSPLIAEADWFAAACNHEAIILVSCCYWNRLKPSCYTTQARLPSEICVFCPSWWFWWPRRLWDVQLHLRVNRYSTLHSETVMKV